VFTDVLALIFFASVVIGRLAAIDANEAVRILLITAIPGLAPLKIENIRIGVRM
jgi:hypothetical protein